MKIQELEAETLDIDESVSAAADSPAPAREGNRGKVVRAVCAVLAVAAVGAWALLFFVVRPDDSALAPDRQQAAVDAAADAAVAILTYKSDTVDADLAAADSLVTGTFGDYYRTFTRDVVAPAAKEKNISTTASVVGKAISEFSADRAVVVVFLNQATTTADVAQPAATTTTIRIEVERHGDDWLVSKFDPA